MAPRPGRCPSCDNLFNAEDRIPMVSVVCGHSLCKSCAMAPLRTEGSTSDTDSSNSDDPSDRPVPTCPVCSAQLAGFVKNFEALAALQSHESSEASAPAANSTSGRAGPTSDPHADAPDLSAVVHEDLVIDRAAIHFTRSPAHEVGKGASAVVYRGVYEGTPVAIKCIRTMSDSFATEDRLRRELRNASRLKNAHIVAFRGAAWDFEDGPATPRNVLLVTELMAGGNLRENLGNLPDGAGLDIPSFIPIALQIARGIEYLHAEGLAHRDIKSANILLTERLPRGRSSFPPSVRAKIADFGLSKYIDKATGGGTVMQSILEPGRLEATYSYLAPEAFGGDKTNIIRRTDLDDDDDGRYDEMAKKRDIYALGVLFWEMLTGRIPWGGVSLPDVYVRVCVRSDRPYPALSESDVDKTFHRLVDRCWAQNPTRRPSARSIVAKLEKLAVKYRVPGFVPEAERAATDTAAAAVVESASVVSGGKNSAPSPAARSGRDLPTTDSHKEPEQVLIPPSESLLSYQKMPSASTVHTTHNESKTHSIGLDPSETGLDRTVDDFPAQFDEPAWMDDADPNGRLSHRSAAAHSSSQADPGETGSNRRSIRARQPSNEHGDHHSRPALNVPGTQPPPQPHPQPQNKNNATAVAATAAAIAAAKDRERKRDDVRQARSQAAARAARANGVPVQAAGTTAAAGETSFPSLPPGAENWNRAAAGNNVSANPPRERAVFFDNSDEEAQDFDPDRAAADEALAESNEMYYSHVPASRAATPVNRGPTPSQQRSTSLGRVNAARPISPVVRRPMSPAQSRPFSPPGTQARAVPATHPHAHTHAHTHEETHHSVSRTSDAAVGVPPKRSASASRGRLARTLSASAQGNGSARGPVSGSQAALSSVNSVVGTTSATASQQQAADSSSKRAFIRRMRSNETSRRMARSSSSTGVEANKRSKPTTTKSMPSHVSDTLTGDDIDDDVEYTVVQIGSGPKEDFIATVDELDKVGLMRLLSQRMQPLRLAALAHAALLSSRHRNDEEILRNSCAYLHRLIVPSASGSGKTTDGQEIPAKEQVAIRKFLKSRQGVEALLQALHPAEVRHPTTLSYGLLALGNLTAWDLEAHKQFRNSHGVVQVTQVMKVHLQNNGVQEKGCYALACVGAAYPAKAKSIFEQSGALDVVIRALSEVMREEPNDAVIKQACAALGAMCSSSPTNSLYAGRKDSLLYLVSSFERFRKMSKGDGGGKRSEMRLVCKAFIDLLCHPENRKVAGAKGGSTMVIRAMRIFRLDKEFIEKLLGTLSEFCALRSNGTNIVQANGVDDIVAAMERFRMSEVMQREGARVLTLLMKATGDQARRRMVQAGGGEAMVFALERFGGIQNSNEEVVIEAFLTLQMLFMMENASEGEILGRRMKKIRCDKAIKAAMVAHKTDTEIQEKGREALRYLGNLKGGGIGLWNRMRNGQRKW